MSMSLTPIWCDMFGTDRAMMVLRCIRKDNQCISLLCKAVDESILEVLMNCSTSKAIWDKLKLLHDQSAHESVHHIQQRFYECRMEGLTL